jgi:Ran GTPase-activating protein (RanGAP) involved in mRNA processing and transport
LNVECKQGTYTAEGIKAIADAIRVSHFLNSIDISGNRIGQAASLELLAAMESKKMVRIGMAGCNLGAEGAKIVAKIVAVSSSLMQALAFSRTFLHNFTLHIQTCAFIGECLLQQHWRPQTFRRGQGLGIYFNS